MAEDAIQQDVSEEEAIEEEIEYRAPRDAAYAAIVANRTQALAAEEEAFVEEEVIAEAPGAKEEVAPEIEMITMYGEGGEEYKVPASARLKLKIDGEEIEEPLDKMTRSHQKGASGDKRLEQAVVRHRELEEKERALNARGEALSQQEQATLKQLDKMEQKREAGSLSDDDFLKVADELYASFLEEDEDSRKANIANVLKRVAAKPQQKVDIVGLENRLRKEITSQVLGTVKTEQVEDLFEADKKSANSRFNTEFASIKADNDLYTMARTKATELYNADPSRPLWDIMKDAGDHVNGIVERLQKPAAARKSTPTPRPASGRSVVGTDDPPPQKRTEVLQDMRKGRMV